MEKWLSEKVEGLKEYLEANKEEVKEEAAPVEETKEEL